MKELVRAFVDTFESIQQERIRANNRLLAMQKLGDERDPQRERFMQALTKLEEVEGSLTREINRTLKDIPVYSEFLLHIKGIGPLLGARLLALPLKLGAPLSSWNAYFGMTPHYWKATCKEGHKVLLSKPRGFCPICGAPLVSIEYVNQAPRKTRGYKGFWNSRARKLAFLVSEQFVKTGERGFYGRAYRNAKKRYATPNTPPIISDARARRHAFKLFLSHFYEASHELAGIEPMLPYAFEYLKDSNHDRISWKEVVEIEKAWQG